MRRFEGHVEGNGSLASISNFQNAGIFNPFIRLGQMANYRLFGLIDDFVAWQVSPVKISLTLSQGSLEPEC